MQPLVFLEMVFVLEGLAALFALMGSGLLISNVDVDGVVVGVGGCGGLVMLLLGDALGVVVILMFVILPHFFGCVRWLSKT